ncbi:response regulator transcription factor [Mucilaginibacter sp. HD30]
MAILKNIIDILYRRQKLLEVMAVFLFLCTVAIRFDSRGLKMAWTNYPTVALILALVTVLLAITWLKIEKSKTQQLINNIKLNSHNSSLLETKLNELSLRQREVLDLIMRGLSNKEITSQLMIEHSTLKTHINSIYKTLGISSRKEAQLFAKQLGK